MSINFQVRWADNTEQLKRNLAEGLDQIEVTRSAVDKLAKSMGGENLLRAANNYAAALQKIGGEAGALGGIEKQTAAERERGNALLQKTIEKYTALGQAVPTAIKDLAELTAKQVAASKAAQQLAKDEERLIEAFSGTKATGQATALASAIEKIGGASKLTATEQASVNRQVTEAIAKYAAMGQQAPGSLTRLAEATKQVNQPTSILSGYISDLGKNIVSTAAGFISAQAVIGAVSTAFHALAGFVGESIKAYADAEAAQNKLVAALRTQHTATPEVISQYNALATQFQKTTVFSDDLINSMQGLLVQVGGVMPSQMRDALKASTDLAAGLGIDLQSATNLVAKAAAGHTETLGKYGITVSEAALATKGFDAVLEAINRQFGGQAAAQVETYAGKVEQLKNSFNNVQEAVGKYIIQNPIITRAIGEFVTAAQAADEGSSEWHASFADLVDFIGGPGSATMLAGLGLDIRAWEALAAQANAADAAMRHAFAIGPPKEWMMQPATAPRPSITDLPEADRLKMALQDLRIKADGLTEAQKRVALSAFAEGQSVEQVKKILEVYWPTIGKSTAALDKLKEQYTKNAAEQKKYAEAQQEIAAAGKTLGETLHRLTLDQQNQITALLKAGVGIEAIKTVYHLTDVEAKGLQTRLAALNRILEIESGAGKSAAQALEEVGKMGQHAAVNVTELQKTLEKVLDLEHGIAGFPDIGKVGGRIFDPKLEPAIVAAGKFKKSIDDLSSAFAQLAQVTDGSMSDIARDIGGVFSALSLAQKGLEQFNDAEGNAFQKTAGLVAASAALIQVTASKYKATAIAGGALIGSEMGASIGGAIAGPAGAAIGQALGAIAGALTGLFRSLHKSEAQKAAQDVGRDFGVAISEGLAKAIEGIEKTEHVKRIQAVAIALKDVIKEAGGLNTVNVGGFTDKLRDAFVFLERKELTLGQVTKILDDNFADFAKAGTSSLGFLSAKLVDIIKLNQRFGTQSKEIASYITAQTEDITKGFDAVAASGILTQESFDRMGRLAAVSFDAALASGQGLLEAVTAVGPGLDALQKSMTDFGFSAAASVQELLQFRAFAETNQALVAGINGLNQVMTGLNNTGRITEQAFDDIALTAVDLRGKLLAAGLTGDQSLRAMQPTLQRLWELQQKYNFTLGEAETQLIEEAKALDLVGETQKPIAEQQLDATHEVRDAIVDLARAMRGLPAIAQDAANGMEKAFNGININPVDVPVTSHGFEPSAPPEGFASGSGGFRDFGAGTLAVLHGREAVVTEQQLRESSSGTSSTAGPSAAVGQTFIIHNTFNIGGDADLVNTVRRKVIPIIHDEYDHNINGARTRGREVLQLEG